MTAEDFAVIFRRVLETEQVEPSSDFFELGGDSLLATRVLSAVARDYGIELSFDDFATASTPQALFDKVATVRA